MSIDWSQLNLWAILVSVVAGQVISTVWFVALFGEPWAKEYGASSRQEHTKAIPGYTYGVQLLCTVATTVCLAILQLWAGVDSIGSALILGALVSVGFCVATGLPGQAFLKRWRVAAITLGCQSTMIMVISAILGAWRA